ncbi:MAG TPA: ABC transporter permease/substrate-binding protein [Candidatus Binatia bacterium]
MSEQLALLPSYLTSHLQLTLAALALAIAASLPLGVLATRVPRLEKPLLGMAAVVQTIPALALLAVMVPLLAALNLRSIGFLPALIGLTLYGVLPILRNTVTGILGVDPALKEAARGVGMTAMQQLRLVELPLALPVIVAGVRTATVWTVGMATLSTPVGAPSLGNYIFGGLQTRNFAAVLVGSVAAAALALVLDALVYGVELGIRRRRRALVAGCAGVLALLAAWATAPLVSQAARPARPIVIGAKTFTEQYVLAELLAEWIRRETGRDVVIRASLGSTVAYDALASDDVDLYVDYSGTLWATILRREGVPESREAAIREIARFLRERDGVELVCELGFENAYALAVREADGERLGIRTIGDLARHAPEMTIGSDYEFFSRPEWRALQETYGLRFAERRSMDPSLMYQAAAVGEVDVISAFSTDGRIAALDLRVLVDDRGAIPPYDAVVLASARLAREHPEVIAALRALAGTIDAARMRRANLEVDERGRGPREVGRELAAALRDG